MSPSRDRRLAALVEAGMVLASELELDSLLQRIADLARDVVGARYAAVGVLAEEGPHHLSRFVYSGIDEATAERIGDLPRGRGVLGVLIEEGRPLRLPEISEHQRSYGFPPAHPEMHTFLGVPIVVRGRVFGRLYLTEKEEGEEFTKDDERIALTLASQAGIAVENARLVDEAKERRRELDVLEERERISKELHDGVIQSIYSVGLSLQGSLSLMDRDGETARRRIDGAIAELDNVVRDVRSYIFELRPKAVEEHGLSAAIKELARDIEVNALVGTELDVDEQATLSLDEHAQTDVVQVIREVLSNIARHAKARNVHLALHMDDVGFELTIEDDGIGFDPGSVERGHGLRNMEERARKLRGHLEISTRPGGGTRHRLEIPREG
ncbi:MAG: GAF domain-containing protein [Actinobacteria bacterium]|nr:GAF domain-containing protein [Actinomycetota bacterium]